MTSRSIRCVYFSPTGTSKLIATTLSSELSNLLYIPYSEFDFTSPNTRKDPMPSFQQDDIIILALPVYAGRVPNLLLNYLSTIQSSGSLAIPVVLYGNRAFDDALVELRNILEEHGAHTIAGLSFIGEHSFSRTMAANRPDQNDLSICRDFAKQIANKILSIAEDSEFPPVWVAGNNPPGPYFRPTDLKGNFLDIRKVKPITTDACIDCKLCTTLCPLGSIDENDPSLITGICMKCSACIKRCPVSAKQFTDEKFIIHRDDIVNRYSNPRKEPELFL